MVDFEPGKRVKDALGSEDRDVQAVVGSVKESVFDVPDNPGPAVTGRTPILGQFRRQRNMPVVRDRLTTMFD